MNFPHISGLHHRVNVRQYRAPLLDLDENTRLRLALDRWRFAACMCLFAASLLAAVLVFEIIGHQLHTAPAAHASK